MQLTALQNKDIPHTLPKPKSINELLKTGGQRLGALRARSAQRSTILAAVIAALPTPLAAQVVSAGLESGQLTIGVTSATWASRLRYATDALRTRMTQSLGVEILRIRIKVLPSLRSAAG